MVKQNPPLLPQAPDLLHSLKNASLHVQIDYLKEGEKRLIYEGTEPLTIYSRDDFAWDIPGFHNGSLFLAAMVTPNDPALDDLLREAADYPKTDHPLGLWRGRRRRPPGVVHHEGSVRGRL